MFSPQDLFEDEDRRSQSKKRWSNQALDHSAQERRNITRSHAQWGKQQHRLLHQDIQRLPGLRKVQEKMPADLRIEGLRSNNQRFNRKGYHWS